MPGEPDEPRCGAKVCKAAAAAECQGRADCNEIATKRSSR